MKIWVFETLVVAAHVVSVLFGFDRASHNYTLDGGKKGHIPLDKHDFLAAVVSVPLAAYTLIILTKDMWKAVYAHIGLLTAVMSLTLLTFGFLGFLLGMIFRKKKEKHLSK